eukprot:11049357-Lingulodinium_polyedra.AAC.1
MRDTGQAGRGAWHNAERVASPIHERRDKEGGNTTRQGWPLCPSPNSVIQRGCQLSCNASRAAAKRPR